MKNFNIFTHTSKKPQY